MRKTLSCAIAVLLLLPALPVLAIDLSVMPVAIHLDRDHDRTTVRVTNQGREPAVLQADAIGWRREAGIDKDTDTSDLIVNPPVFTVAPGQTQIVRVGLRRDSDGAEESTYRMVLREVPSVAVDPTLEVQSQVRVLVSLRVPVYVAPRSVRREQRWAASYDTSGRLVAAVTNTGNVHYKVGSVRATTNGGVATRTEGPQSVLMPGEERSFVLQTAAAAPNVHGPLTLEVLTDRGMQYVPVDVVQN